MINVWKWTKKFSVFHNFKKKKICFQAKEKMAEIYLKHLKDKRMYAQCYRQVFVILFYFFIKDKLNSSLVKRNSQYCSNLLIITGVVWYHFFALISTRKSICSFSTGFDFRRILNFKTDCRNGSYRSKLRLTWWCLHGNPGAWESPRNLRSSVEKKS